MTARKIIKILEEHGWELDRINGSHHIFRKHGYRSVTVPFHGNRDLAPLDKIILRQAKIR